MKNTIVPLITFATLFGLINIVIIIIATKNLNTNEDKNFTSEKSTKVYMAPINADK